MPEQAMAGLAKLQTLTSDQAKLAEIRAEVEAAIQAAEQEPPTAEPVVEEITADDVPSLEVAEEAPVAPEPPAAEELPVVAEAAPPAPEPAPAPVLRAPVPKPTPAPTAAPEPAPHPGVLTEFVNDLESSLGNTFLPGTVAKPEPAAPAPLEPVVAAAQTAPALGAFVADIEASLGEDFLKAAPVAGPARPAAPPKPVPPIPAAPAKAAPLAASAAASAAPTAPAAPQISHPVAPTPVVAAAAHTAPAMVASAIPVPVVDVPRSQPPVAHASAAPAAKASPFAEDAGVDLAEMFGELKQDLEADVAAADEDPETHYNLGIAFREMGLLDEAIGELQKACQSFDHGHPFQQIMQTYTWLAQCFLEKGVPEAAVRWYEKALNVANIDGETRVALNYELASAYEASGDKASALKHFMDVYGSNIDYRDVAERIKALKS